MPISSTMISISSFLVLILIISPFPLPLYSLCYYYSVITFETDVKITKSLKVDSIHSQSSIASSIWWPRDPQYPAFEEGDMVGINQQGLLDRNISDPQFAGIYTSIRSSISILSIPTNYPSSNWLFISPPSSD